MKWTTKNDEEIEIKKMTTEHLKKTISFIENNTLIKEKIFTNPGYDGDSYVPDFMHFTRKATKKEIQDNHVEYKEMCKELKKRLLKQD